MNSSINNIIKPIIEFGYMRSGTTLLFNLLKNHPEIYTGVAEPKLLVSMHSIKKVYSDLTQEEILKNYIAYIANVVRFSGSLKQLHKPLIENEEFCNEDLEQVLPLALNLGYFQVINLVYDYLTRKSGKSFWLFKSQIVFFDEIHSSMPDAVFIEIVRDSRDVLASKKKDKESVWHSDKYSKEKRQFKNFEKTYDPLWDSLSWKSEVIAGIHIKDLYPTIIKSIYYENLARDPKTCTQKLCQYLNIEFHDNQLEVPRRNSSLWQERPGGIGTESVNKWKNILIPEETTIIQFITKRELNHHHYNISPTKPNIIKLFFLLLRSVGEFFQRLVKRILMGGIPFFQNVILIYWKKFKNNLLRYYIE